MSHFELVRGIHFWKFFATQPNDGGNSLRSERLPYLTKVEVFKIDYGQIDFDFEEGERRFALHAQYSYSPVRGVVDSEVINDIRRRRDTFTFLFIVRSI